MFEIRSSRDPAGPETVGRLAGQVHRAACQAMSNVCIRIVGFLRAGYPAGVSSADCIPLLALLKRRLTDYEIAAITIELTERSHIPVDDIDIRAAITKIANDVPDIAGTDRVARYLEAHGWPRIADEFTPPETSC